MGTGIVAVALVGLPVRPPGATAVALALWLLACGLLVLALVRPWTGPVTASGAPPMALMTVATGAHLLLGAELAAGLLWTVGTLLGLVVAVVVPRRRPAGDTGATWLMPAVPPVVSAASGAALVPHPVCWALLAVGLLRAAPIAILVVRGVLRHGPGPAAGVPALWIVLGPLGQSATAVHHLDGPVVGYGAVALGLAGAWLAVVATLTLRAAREGLPFGPGWWAFTFPLGTVVTGTSGLAEATGHAVLDAAAGLLFLALAAAWAVVATRSIRAAAGRAPAPSRAPGTASAAADPVRPRPAAGRAAGRTASGRP